MQENHAVGNRLSAQFALFVLAVFSGSAAKGHAACTGPAALVAQLKAHPTTDNAALLGSWYASHKQFGCAVETFRAGIKSDPKSAQLHYLTGVALIGSNDGAGALPELQKAVQLDPTVLQPHLTLAFVLDQTGKRTEAEQQWRQALAIDPKSAMALEGLTADLSGREDYQGVVLLLQDAPRSEELNIQLAQALGHLRMYNQAYQVLEPSLHASPNSVTLVSATVDVLMKTGRYQEAINLLQHAVDTNPADQKIKVELFRALVLTGHIDQARPWGPKLLELRPKDPEVLRLNGIVYRSVGDYPQAKTLLEKAVAIDPNFSDSRYNLGMVLVLLKEWQGAKEQLEKAIELGAPEAQAHFELAKALRGLGENNRALEEMQ